MKIGEFIKYKRKEKKFSINQLGLYSEVSAAHISRIERGLREPSPEILKKLAPQLSTSYEELMEIAGYISKENTETGLIEKQKNRELTNKEYSKLADEIIEMLIENGEIVKGEKITDEKQQRILNIIDQAIKLTRL